MISVTLTFVIPSWGFNVTHDLNVINICANLFHFICAQFKSNQNVKLTGSDNIFIECTHTWLAGFCPTDFFHCLIQDMVLCIIVVFKLFGKTRSCLIRGHKWGPQGWNAVWVNTTIIHYSITQAGGIGLEGYIRGLFWVNIS